MLLYPGWRSFFSSLFCHALFQLCKFCGTFFISAIDFCLQDSSELSEVTGLSDRVLVMYHGEIVGSFRSDDVSFNELGLYMSGVKRMSSEELSEE